MAMQIGDNFSLKSRLPLDARVVYPTINDMISVPSSSLYDGIIAYEATTSKFYTYKDSNTVDPTYGKWRDLKTAGYTIASATIDSVSTSATYGHLILTLNDTASTQIDCGSAIGPKGDGFAIIKLYNSISSMTGDTSPVQDGQMVAVVYTSGTTTVAKVYIRNSSQSQTSSGSENGYTFFCNLADATVIQGPQGPKGDSPVITITTVAATSTKPEGKKVTITVGTGPTAVSTDYTVYNGMSIKAASVRASDGHLILTMTDNSTIDAGAITGGSGSGSTATMILGCYASAPTTFVTGDIYYNTTSNKLFTATTSTAWDAGSVPQAGGVYISIADQTIYSYDVTNGWRPYGGGSSVSVSSKSDNALQNVTGSATPSEDGLYVKDLTPLVNSINLEQKVTNKPGITELLTAPISMPLNSATTAGMAVNTTLNQAVPLNDDITKFDTIRIWLCPITTNRKRTPQSTDLRVKDIVFNASSSTPVETDGSNITCLYSVDNTGSQTAGAVHLAVKGWFKDNKTLHINICTNPLTGSNWNNMTIVSVEGVIDTFHVIDQVSYVDDTVGMEDYPIGSIISKIGITVPKHYLPCDGSIQNIVDYPYLAQFIKQEFGSINYFGGDGITTFALPNLSGGKTYTKVSPIMTGTATPSPYKVTESSMWSSAGAGYKAFDGNKSYSSEANGWISNIEDNPWLKLDFGFKTTVDAIKIYTQDTLKWAETISVWGSDDDSNYTKIKTFSGITRPSDGIVTLDLQIKANYRYYKLVVDNLVLASGAKYIRWIEVEFYSSTDTGTTYIKAEPTYFMEINQNVYTNQCFKDYSEEEKIIGRWKDGKPVYSKGFNTTVPNCTTEGTLAYQDINVSDLNIDRCTYIEGNTTSTLADMTLPSVVKTGYIDLWYKPNTKVIRLANSASNYNGRSTYITVEYTKTTDAPNSFDYAKMIAQYSTIPNTIGVQSFDMKYHTINQSLAADNTKVRTLWAYTNLRPQVVKLSFNDDLIAYTNTGSNEGYIEIFVNGQFLKKVTLPTLTNTPVSIDQNICLKTGESIEIKTNWTNSHTGCTWDLKGNFFEMWDVA